MATHYDVIVAGLGAMGSAAAFHLAKAGRRVLGLDRFRPPHEFGSSHGRTRIIREAYFEHPSYVPLVQRAYELWAELERESGHRLLRQTGGLMIGPPGGPLVEGAAKSAQQHRLEYRLLSAEEVRHEFPGLRPTDDMVAVWEPRAGILFPELAVRAHLDLATRAGATLRYEEPLLRWESSGAGVRVTTPLGCYYATRLLLSAGAWMPTMLAELKLPFSVERQVLCWFKPAAHPELFGPDRFPISLWEYEPSRFFYCFPDLGDGVKGAIHHEGEKTEPEHLRREVGSLDTEPLRLLMDRLLPGAAGPLLSAVVCMYTDTPDSHFVLGWHPRDRSVLIVSPCSGHGFKFSSAIGEVAASLLMDQVPSFDLTLFSPKRF